MTAILGISAFSHDSAAALVVAGRIVATAQEERFTRKRHDHDFPAQAVQSCPSPFEEAATPTIDGVGEWATASFGIVRGNRITLSHQLRFPRFLGRLYASFRGRPTLAATFWIAAAALRLVGLWKPMRLRPVFLLLGLFGILMAPATPSGAPFIRYDVLSRTLHRGRTRDARASPPGRMQGCGPGFQRHEHSFIV